MKWLTFAGRNTKEILRDPLTLGFGLGFPIVLLVLLSTIQRHVPVELFRLETLTPGVAVFGLSFLSLFSAQLLSRDVSTAFLARLLTTPLTASDFILGYTLPLLPMALAQCAVCGLCALALGLPFSSTLPTWWLGILPAALFFIALGLLLGSLLTERQVGGICGALLTNLSAWLSGTWFDLSLLGEGFAAVAGLLPFVHAVEYGRALLAGDWAGVWPHLWWVLGYALVTLAAAVLAFSRRTRR